jgi:2-polyprenyl-3-methyl-5-hydroxy-6-metoxy-1,4-benzoquinol methylase
MTAFPCNVCGEGTPVELADTAMFHSNVRAFETEAFTYYRCRRCASLHARDSVDLAHYYARYPFHNLPVDWRLRTLYGNFLRRLRLSGLRAGDRILDYGCGGGHFVRYLREQGYTVNGFDEYSSEFGKRSVLDERYDCIVSQDVIEHVPAPHALLDDFSRIARPSALIALGTPDASAIDLKRPQDYVHAVHAPYHRHILSKTALVQAGEQHGWKLEHFYPTMYSNTFVPFLSERFYLYYTSVTDGTLDSLMEPVHAGALLLRAPATLFWGCLGGFFSRHTDVMALFRVP